MRLVLLPAMLVVISVATAGAKPPDTSPRPLPRPVGLVATGPASATPVPVPPASSPLRLAASSSASPISAAVTEALAFGGARPLQRPADGFVVVPPAAAERLVRATAAAPAMSPQPQPRPHGLQTTEARPQSPAAAAPPRPPRLTLASLFGAKPGQRGSVCGDAAIIGTTIASIPATAAGCGLTNGVRVTAVSGIALSEPVTIDCDTARALKTWVDNGIIPAIGRKGGGLARLEIAASYSCRPRNGVAGAKTSEHGKGHAVDVSGVTLADGATLTVAQGWNADAKILRAIHASACGTFGTVLGPKSDVYHRDHFHVDTARYRSGSYCR